MKIVKSVLFVIVLFVFMTFLLLWLKSPGTLKPILDAKGNTLSGSICEQSILEIGGKAQHLTIRATDSSNSVVLFLHGGPGNPIVEGLRNPELILAKELVLVEWDQFGSGRSYSKSIKAEEMKVDSLIAYAAEISKYLAKRFDKEKIYLIGHSWGTQLGMLLINKHPELFYNYIGLAQTTDVYKAESIAFNWVKEKAKMENDESGIAALSNINFPDTILDLKTWNDRFGWVHRKYVNKYQGVNYGEERSMVGASLLALFHEREFTINEKINYIKGLQFSLAATWQERLSRPLRNEIDSVQIPVIIVHGEQDYNIPHAQAFDYFQELKAPYKKFYSFEKSAHYPYAEEVEKFNEVIRKEILNKE